MDRRRFYLFLAVVGIHSLMSRLTGFFMPSYLKSLGLSGLQIGFFFSVSTIATILLSLPMGVSTDRISIVKILAVSFLLMAMGPLGLIFTTSFAVFCFFSFIGSFGGRFYQTAINSFFFKISDARDGNHVALYQLTTFIMTGLSMLLGSLIIAQFSYRVVFVASALGNLVLMGISAFLPTTETTTIALTEYKRELLRPRALFITAVFSLSALHWGAETVSYGPFLLENLGLTVRQTGLYTAVGFIFVGAGTWLANFLLRRGVFKDMQTVLLVGLMIGGLFHILMCVPWPVVSFVMRLFHEIGDGFVFLAFYTGIARTFNIATVGGSAAFVTLWQSVASFLSALLFGWLGEQIGHHWPLIISGLVMTMLPLVLHVGQYYFEESRL